MKKIVFTFLAMVVALSTLQMSYANDYTNEANQLKSLNLFSGTNEGFELDRIPKRIEAAAMLVNFLGKAPEAIEKHYAHPFTDVPQWADSFVGYLYHNGMTTGIGNNLFGSNHDITARDFTVFMLTSLGYNHMDFEYMKALDFALEIGLVNEDDRVVLESNSFLRGHMVHISYNALSVSFKGSEDTLLDKLTEHGIVSRDSLQETDLLDVYVIEIPIDNIEALYFNNPILTVSTRPISTSFSSIYKVGYPMDSRNEEAILASFTGTKKFKSWEDHNIVFEVEFLKNGKSVFKSVSVTAPFLTTQVAFMNSMPIIPCDTMRVTIQPISNYEVNRDIVVTRVSTDDSSLIEKKISGAYAINATRMVKFMLESPLYSFEDNIRNVVTVAHQWEDMSNGYKGQGTLVLDNTYCNNYHVWFNDTGLASMGFPPNILENTVMLMLAFSETTYASVYLYDENQEIYEIIYVD